MEIEKDQKKLLKEELLLKDKEKMEIEKQIEEVTKNLKQYPSGFDDKLVDDEGFPSEDLDYGKLKDYRILKKKQNVLFNDYKVVMKELGNLQEKYFAMVK